MSGPIGLILRAYKGLHAAIQAAFVGKFARQSDSFFCPFHHKAQAIGSQLPLVEVKDSFITTLQTAPK
jgi:hypothetical protein